jgi:hypothetical protein
VKHISVIYDSKLMIYLYIQSKLTNMPIEELLTICFSIEDPLVDLHGSDMRWS